MDPSFYGSASSLYYSEQCLQHKTNNITNSNTATYRSSQLVIGSREDTPDQLRRMRREVRKSNPTNYGVSPMGVIKNFSTSKSYTPTNNLMDVALSEDLPNAFFAVRDPSDPQAEVFYTRYGRFAPGPIDPTDPSSPTALFIGKNLVLDSSNSPIMVDLTNGPLRMGTEGQIFQKEEQVGEVPVYTMDKTNDPMKRVSADLQKLEQCGGMLYSIPTDAAKEFYPRPIETAINHEFVKVGVIEGSNVEAMTELADTMDLRELAGANRIAMTSYGETMSKFFEMVRAG